SSRFPLFLYLGTIMLITAIFTGGLLVKANADGLQPWLLLVTSILSLLCASQLAIAVVNWLATLLETPHSLPRMDFSKGIPPESRTLAIVPTMLTSARNIEDLIEALEVRFLANRDKNLHFGLLTDFPDAAEEILPEDDPLLLLARQRIEELNEKYGNAKGDTFFLFHRPRRWNPMERVWMGYERKRGKLAELNSFLRNGSRDRFSLVVGNIAALLNVKFVITLDTDTQLPRDSARQLVGAMAHPLNRAQYDEGKQRVVAGYGILQPRVAVSLPGTNRSRYARMEGNDPGIDPYTRAVSDVYQDLFLEGSFIGKGIYEVDAFERALDGRFPENRILSHDLIEGCYARAGLLSDVMVYEEYPSRYSTDVSRRHRWIRGDWQLLSWLRAAIPGPGPVRDRQRRKNPLSLLSQWKLFDNLRRSLVPSAMMLLLLLGWTILSSPWFWTVSMIGIILIPSFISSILDLLQKPRDVLPGQHLAAAGRSIGRRFSRDLFTLVCLPYEAFFSLDAIVRTIWRMLVTHKRLLEWSPSGDPDRKDRTGLAAFCRTMWFAPFLAVAMVIYLALSNPAALGAAGSVLVLWFASPIIAWWISRPLAPHEARLTAGQTVFLRKLSRKTWAFFETFVGTEDNWLPPDNYQEYRAAVVAHRTSPTNMGLALLANLSAYDFGYISTGQLIERTENALRTMKALDRHRGHFYNWYDTQSLKPLQPKYVSTVDSGNLAANLLTLRQGLLALPDHKIVHARLFDGLSDTLQILVDAAGRAAPTRLAQLQKDLASANTSPPTTLAVARLCLDQLTKSAAEAASEFDSLDLDPEGQAAWWAHALVQQCRAARDDLILFAQPIVGIDVIPTLRELASMGNDLAVEKITAIENLVLQSGELSQM
ncbi:MAG TPA: cyclic beta 1-2 glucan synthetase, partial [Nitrospirota bacterium]